MVPRFWFALAAVVLVGAVGMCADPPRPPLEDMRAVIKKLWSNKPDEIVAAYKQLEGDPHALPVLRAAATTDPDLSHRGVLEKLVEKATKAHERELVTRVEQWAADGRLDFLTEVRSLTDGDAAEQALDHLLRAASAIGPIADDLGKRRWPAEGPAPAMMLPRLPWSDVKAFRETGPKPLFDVEVTLAEQTRLELAAFADRIAVPGEERRNAVVAGRSGLTHLARNGTSTWTDSIVLVNSDLLLDVAHGCLVVADGDVHLRPTATIKGSVVVANGRITQEEGVAGPRFSWSAVWASGDLTLEPRNAGPQLSLFFAGGKVANADKLAAKGCAEQNVTEPPLPVRFLDPAADYGLTLEAGKDGMKVSKVADKSAFADYLKAGDVIAAVTGVKTPTAPAFRRELRRGIVEGAMLLDVTRGKEKLELLVPVPDVPPAPKTEKKDEPKAKPVEK